MMQRGEKAVMFGCPAEREREREHAVSQEPRKNDFKKQRVTMTSFLITLPPFRKILEVYF